MQVERRVSFISGTKMEVADSPIHTFITYVFSFMLAVPLPSDPHSSAACVEGAVGGGHREALHT